MNLSWVKCEGNVWCSLEQLNLESISNIAGVYIIWHGGAIPRCVRIGQGDIKVRLSAHRNDPEIMACCSQGELFVTWAEVPVEQRGGVEAYLAQTCVPLVGTRFPERMPIAVNLPAICGNQAHVGAQLLSKFHAP